MLKLDGLRHLLEMPLSFAIETAQASSLDGTLDFPRPKLVEINHNPHHLSQGKCRGKLFHKSLLQCSRAHGFFSTRQILLLKVREHLATPGNINS